MATSTQWQLARDSAERYEQVLVPTILGPAARALVDWANLEAGQTVLDVGCGTGAATRAAAERVGVTGRVFGLDVNAGMLAIAQALAPPAGAEIEWRQHSAYQLPFDDETVDVVLCAQTLQFMNDRPLALSEMHRVLKPGGHLVASLWCDLPQNPYFHVLVETIASDIGSDTAAGLKAAFSLSRADEIRALVMHAGFKNIRMNIRHLDLELPRLANFVPRHIGATPMAAGFAAASAVAQQAIIQKVIEQLVTYESADSAQMPFRTHLVMATP